MSVNRSVAKTRQIALGVALSLAACSGGHGTPATPVAVPAASAAAATSSPVAAASGLVTSQFTIDVPKPVEPATQSSTARRPEYVSTATKSVKVLLNSPPTGFVQPAVLNITTALPNATCATDPLNTGNYQCTETLGLPPGSDSLTVTAYSAANAAGSILSQQTKTFTLAVGVTNALSISLDANVANFTMNAAGPCRSLGPVGATLVEAAATTIGFKSFDITGATVAGPGTATISVNGSSAASGTAGTLTYQLSQSAQTLAFPAAGGATTQTSVAVALAPPTTTDGLSYALSNTFNYVLGPSPAGQSLIAYASNSSTGAINLTKITIGTGSGTADSFGSAPVATVARTTSATETGVFDIDHPAALAFDAAGDLLIANGGGSAGDSGNLTCLPGPLLFTTIGAAPTISTLAKSPTALAYDATTGNVALANASSTAAQALSEYSQQSGNYATLTAQDVAPPAGEAATAVSKVGNLAAGSFAVALTTGTPKAPHGTGASSIEVSPSGGTPYSFTDPTIDDPTALAFDATNNQLVIGSSSPYESTLDFYSLTSGAATQQKSIALVNGLTGSFVATAPNGYVAVGGPAGLAGDPQIQVYDNTAARGAVGGPIPFNGTTTANGSTYIYDTANGGTAVLGGLTWLSNTKLLVSFGTGVTAKQGLYVFDTSSLAVPTGYDDATGLPFAAAPKNTGFLQTASAPLSAAYLP